MRKAIPHVRLAIGWLALLGACGVHAADIVFVSDFDNGHAIQWVRHHDASAAGVSIALGPALVTATQLSNGNTDLTAWLQVPASLNTNATYPFYSALKTFGPASGGVPGIGACVVAEGTIGNYRGATELAPATFTQVASQYCGFGTISAYAGLTVAQVATDTNTGSFPLEPGLLAEPLESVLIRLTSLLTLTANDSGGDFQVGDSASPNAYLVVANDMYQYNTAQYMPISSITGVLDEADIPGDTYFRLLPRYAPDVSP